MVDSCNLIENHDKEIQKIIELCCGYLAKIGKKESERKQTAKEA